LREFGFDTSLIKVSPKTHIVTSYHIEKDGVKHEIHAILNILPLVDKTALYIAVELKNREFLEHYIAIFLQTGLPGLNLADTWMVRGTDHWFIQPSV